MEVAAWLWVVSVNHYIKFTFLSFQFGPTQFLVESVNSYKF